MKTGQLSLFHAILINLNIILGAGIFINTVELAKLAGVLGCLSYAMIGILLFPLIVSIAKLVSLYPDGGFYTFGSQALSPFAGFISAWSYFIGKLASTTLMIHVSVLLIQQIIPLFRAINTLALDSIIIVTFLLLNLLNAQTGAKIQQWFLVLKLTPIIFVILTGLFLFESSSLEAPYRLWSGMPYTLPLVLYATIGFESTCSISSKIKNASRNGPLAIFISYGIVILIAFLYQLFFYSSAGPLLGLQESYLDAFPLFLQKLFNNPATIEKAKDILNLVIASSALSGAYGILYSNMWNVYTLAKHNHIVGSRLFVQLNKHNIPVMAVVIEGVLCFIYLYITHGSQLPLQQTGAFGVTVAYTISTLALLVIALKKKELTATVLIPLFGLLNCVLLLASCYYNLRITGFYTLITFIGLFLLGGSMYGIKRAVSSKPIKG